MTDNSGLIADALLRTNPELYQQIDGGNSWLSSISQRGARVRLYRKYERGDHRADITDQMRAMLRLTTDDTNLNDFNDNYMRIIIDKMAGRVHASTLSTGDDTADKNWLAPMLSRQSFDAAQGMWWRGAARDGDSFVIVDPETLLWTSEPAFDQYSGVVAVYDQKTRKCIWACKMWSEADSQDKDDENETGGTQVTMHLVVYQPDRVSYWRGQENSDTVEPMNFIVEGTETFTDNEAGETVSAPIMTNVRPWPAELGGRLPVVGFSNQRDNYTMYGESEIRPAIPLQDVLNRTVYSMVMASEFAAFPVNISVGMSVNPGGIVPGAIVNLVLKDAAGTAITDFTAEQVEFIKAARVTQLQAADLSQYTNQIDRIVKEISQATQTPIYGVTTTGAISGDALKQLEIGLIGKIERFQRQNSDALKDLITLTAEMERLFYPGMNAPKISTVTVDWKSPQLLDVDAKITSMAKIYKDMPGLFSDDFYRARLGALLGLKDADIEKESALAREQSANNFDRLIGAGGEIPVA